MARASFFLPATDTGCPAPRAAKILNSNCFLTSTLRTSFSFFLLLSHIFCSRMTLVLHQSNQRINSTLHKQSEQFFFFFFQKKILTSTFPDTHELTASRKTASGVPGSMFCDFSSSITELNDCKLFKNTKPALQKKKKPCFCIEKEQTFRLISRFSLGQGE